MFKIINFPQDEAKAKETAEYVAAGMNSLGVTVNGDLFVQMWSNDDLKVIVEEDEGLVGMCLLRHGNNVLVAEKTATLLDIASKKDLAGLYQFACTIAQALGCRRVTSTLPAPIEGIEVKGYYQETAL